MAYSLGQGSKTSEQTHDREWTPRDLQLRDLTKDVKFDNTQPVCWGAAADVYQGTFGTQAVALKMPRFLSRMPKKDVKRRFWREIEYWSQLKHSNILEMVGLVFEDQLVYVVSVWAHYGTVAQYVKDDPSVYRYPLIHGIMAGINYLHEKDIIHGDIKGNNILVSEAREPMIADFGLSKAPASVTSSAVAGHGAMQWCAPELFEGKTKTKASDVYATALVIYEVLALQMPYEWISLTMPTVVMRSVMNGIRPPCKPEQSVEGEVFEPYWKLAQDGWKAKPSDRLTIRELLTRLELIIPQFVQPARPPTPSEPLVTVPPDQQLVSEAELPILHSGYMNMQSGDISSWFSSRTIPVQHHFQLIGSHLNYYTPEDITPSNFVGSIELSDYTLAGNIKQISTGFEFSLKNSNGEAVYFSVATSTEATQWTQHISSLTMPLKRNNDGRLLEEPTTNTPSTTYGRLIGFFLYLLHLVF